ncbi:hypothetical protein [Streptococcus pneumoniae]
MKYRKKPVVVEAVQFLDTEESIDELCDFGLDPVRIDYADLKNPLLKIETLEGLKLLKLVRIKTSLVKSLAIVNL